MNHLTNTWGGFLNQTNWNHILTFRPHYRLKMFSADSLMKRLFNHPKINKLFYAMEQDSTLDMTHLHILLDTNSQLEKKEVLKALKTNSKSIGYFETALDNEAVSIYCSKHLNHKPNHYDYFYKT